jgi:hypothetical protein
MRRRRLLAIGCAAIACATLTTAAGGDVSGNASLSGAQTTGSYYFLTNLDVQNSAAQGAVVTLGASITDGVASATDDNRRWPNDLAVLLANGVVAGAQRGALAARRTAPGQALGPGRVGRVLAR